MTISKDFSGNLGGCFRQLWHILSMPNNFLGTHNDLDILHCTKKIILTNYFIIKSTKLSKNDYFKGLFMQFGGCFRPFWPILSMPNNFLSTLNASGILHCYIFVQKSKKIQSKSNDYDTNNAKQVTNSENSNYKPRYWPYGHVYGCLISNLH